MFKLIETGYTLETKDFFVYFGNKKSSFQILQNEFKNINFIRMKQIHSDQHRFVEQNDDLKFEVDAISTNQKNIGLCCITADCLPIMIYLPQESLVTSIHAGWRGLAKKIIFSSIGKYNLTHAQVFIGPCIGFSSFEVENDVRDQILSTIKNNMNMSKPINQNKSFVDLATVAIEQLSEIGINSRSIYNLNVDTLTNRNFHSFRRDSAKSGRQISFIALK